MNEHPNSHHDQTLPGDEALASMLGQALSPEGPSDHRAFYERIVQLSQGLEAGGLREDLDEALAATPPSDPQAINRRVVRLTSESQPLEQALGAESLQAQTPVQRIADRVLAQTHPRALRPWRQLSPRWVRRLRYAAAAVILAAEVGITVLLTGIASDARSLVSIEAELSRLASYSGPDSPIDRELSQLNAQLEQVEAWSPIQRDLAGFNQRLSRLEDQVPSDEPPQPGR